MAMVVRMVDWLLEAAGWCAKACTLTLVLLVAGNVLVRYFLREGSVALQELEWHLVSPIALLGMSYALHKGEHVRVDVLYERMPPRLQTFIVLITSVLTIVIALYLASLSVPFVERAYNIGEGSPDPGGLPYRFLLKAFVPLGFALLALQGSAAALQAVRSLLRSPG